MMKTKMMAATLLMAAGTAMAQQNLIVNTVPGTFVDISLNAGAVNLLPAVSLTTSASYDDCSFSFTSTVTNSMFLAGTVRACSNGFVQFGGTAGSTGFSNASIASGTASPLSYPTQALLPFWDDQVLYVNSTANPSNGRLQYLIGDCATLGITATTGPVLIVQWTREDLFGTANATNATYQVQVFQNPIVLNANLQVCAQMLYSNVIFNTGTLAGAANNGGGSATIGFVAGNTGGATSVNNVQWSLNTTSGVSNGTVLSLEYNGGPISPVVSGVTAAPGTIGTGDTTLITATVAPGANPTSTGLAVTVTGAGLTNAQMFDDGTHGDAVAGNGVYSLSTVVSSAPGAYPLTVNVSDAEARTASGAGSLTVSPPTNPTVVPGTALLSATSLRVTGKVTAGAYPTSSGVTVSANTGALAGTVALVDDGTAGDVTAGDGIYSGTVTIPAGTAAVGYPITVSVADAQSRTASTTTSFNNFGVIAGTDSDLTTQDVLSFTFNGHGSAVEWAKFTVAAAVADDGNAATVSTYLDIDTEGTGLNASSIGTLSDTEIGVYDATGAMLVNGTTQANDDDSGTYFHSQLSFGDTAPTRPGIVIGTDTANAGVAGNGRNGNLAVGDYYIVVGNYNVTFVATAFNATTANTGNPNASSYTLNFRTNLPPATPALCSPADIGVQGGVPGQDRLLDNNDFIVFIDYFFNANPIADVGIQGGVPGTDGQFDNNDFIVFIDYFFNGQPNCQG